jgi:ferric-dicitrate binding protein FerR (iron transport regulator)
MNSRNVIKFPRRKIRLEPKPQRLVKSGVIKYFACVAGAVGGTAVMYYMLASNNKTPQRPVSTGVYATHRGEHRCENLPDASRICLNTQTVVRYTFNQGTRNVELVSGEASFAVNIGDHRPFDVRSGALLIHDLSTSFDAYKKIHSTIVTVVDGRVKVVAPIDGASLQKFNHAEAESAWKVAPEYHRLQQVEFDETTGMLHERSMLTEHGLSQLLAWQRGRIDLTGRTLIEALEELSRYQPIENFRFQDETLRAFRVGGELESTHLMDFLDALERLDHIHHTAKMGADGNTVITLSRRQKH